MTGRRLLLAAGSALDAHPLTLIDVAADAGFDGVGLRLAFDGPDPPNHAELSGYVTRAAHRSIVIHDVEVYRINSSSPDPGPLLDAAAALGAEAVLAVSDDPDLVATERQLTVFADRCRAAGVAPALEYMAWTTANDPATAMQLAAATGMHIVVDLLHHHRVGAGPDELATIVASGQLGWVQLADAPARAPDDLIHEARHGRLPPGDGELPLGPLLDALPSDVTISVEVQSDDLRDRLPPAARAELLADAARSVLARHGQSRGIGTSSS